MDCILNNFILVSRRVVDNLPEEFLYIVLQLDILHELAVVSQHVNVIFAEALLLFLDFLEELMTLV